MKSIAIFLNSPYLGGAERSIIHQASLISKQVTFTFFIPLLENGQENESKDLNELVHRFFPKTQIQYISYPKKLYHVSRSGRSNILISILLIFKMIIFNIKIRRNAFDALWINGNKIGLPILIYSYLKFFNSNIIWHFRDYPTSSGTLGMIWKLFSLRTTFDITLISNSDSVKKEVDKLINYKHTCSLTLYNPPGDFDLKERAFPTQDIKLSIISMIAPWKGIHSIILWSSLYENQLIDLGINSIDIYGAPIYKTEGEHSNYYNELIDLKRKLSNKIISFCGLKSPSEIYSNIDILIHPSLKPEPFGRIIIEGWKAQKPVFSTALGGSGELVIDNKTGFVFSMEKPEELFYKIKTVIENEEIRTKITESANKRLAEIELLIQKTLEHLIEDII